MQTWLKNPKTIGAISPSSRFLARAMAKPIPQAAKGPIIELGPGTGSVTRALIARGIDPSYLYLVEFDPDFCELLRRRFPRANIIQGNAYSLKATLAGIVNEPTAAVVSSLPLLLTDELSRMNLLQEALECMEPGAPFVQFTYGVKSPIPKNLVSKQALAITTHRSLPIFRNIPPAFVWTYRQKLNYTLFG